MSEQRSELLARRVRWLDRYRRIVALGIGLLAAPILYVELTSDWPRVTALGLLIASAWVAWWVAELALAGLAALWETEANEIARDRGLPRAIARDRVD